MIARRRTLALLGAVAAGLIAAPGAAAGTFEVPYDWDDARSGFEGWELKNVPEGGVFYRGTKTPGTGLRIAPTATPGLIYRAAESRWSWSPPDGARIRKAQISGVSGKAVQRQFARVWLAIDGEPDDERSEQKELGYSRVGGGAASAVWENRSWTMLAPGSKRSTIFYLWQFTIPCESQEEPAPCAGVAPSDGAEVSMEKAVFTVEDPSKPTAEVTGLSDGTAWTRDRDLRLKVAATDTQSGVSRVEAVVRGGGSARRVVLGSWAPDRFNATPRALRTPPLGTSRTVERTVAVGRKGTTRVSVETTNGAGMKTVQAGSVRVDRERPEVRFPRTVRPTDTVRVADSPSGVREATLTVDGRERDRCEDAASCRLRVPSNVPDRARVSVKVVDRAGNERSGARTARVKGVAGDKRRPKITWPRSLKTGSKATVSDESSGVAEATLSIVDAPAVADRCGDGGRRCTVGVPADSAGKQVRVTAVDRAGNRASSTRRVSDRRCRPQPGCDAPDAKSAFLTYPETSANLWAGPLRFRWSRPAISGVEPGEPLWYRLELDGEEVYAGPELEHEEFGVETRAHRWRVSVFASSTSRRRLARADRGFVMTPYSTPGGAPTDTDDTEGLSSAAGTPGDQATSRARSPSGVPRSSIDLPLRYMPKLRFQAKERWSPIDVDGFLKEGHLECKLFPKEDRRCRERPRGTTALPAPGSGYYLDLTTINAKDTEGTSNDDRYRQNRGCDADGDGWGPRADYLPNWRFECAKHQPIYHLIRAASGGNVVAIEYWWFYRYNDGNASVPKVAKRIGDHEGDWEGITVFVRLADKGSPASVRDVVYQQHGKAVHYKKQNLSGLRPLVFPARGRHASYPRDGLGIHVPPKYTGIIGAFEVGLRSKSEDYRGDGPSWIGNALTRGPCKARESNGVLGSRCLKPYPIANRKSWADAPQPTGWGAYHGPWGGSLKKILSPSGQEDSPEGPGFGANTLAFVDPFAFRNDSISPPPAEERASGRQAAPRVASNDWGEPAAPCSSWLGGGVVALGCGTGLGGGSVTVRYRDGAELRETADDVDAGPGAVAQLIGRAPTVGDRLEVRGGSGVGELYLVATGAGGQPYVAHVTGLDVTGARELRVGRGPGGAATIEGLPAGTRVDVTAGPAPGTPAAYLAVTGRRATIWLPDGATPRGWDVTASGARATTRRPVRPPLSGTAAGGYRAYAFRVPKGTTSVSGQLRVPGRKTPVLVDLEANLPVFEPGGGARSGRGDLVGEPARPTK